MSMENLVQSLHSFFPWNGIFLCHVQLTSFSARSFSLVSFAVILDALIILVYFGVAWETCSLHSSQSRRTQKSFPPSCKQDRKESRMSRLSYNLYHEALLSHAYNLPRLCHCEFPCWESSSDWIIWVNFSWNTSAEWDLPLSSPCCQQSSGSENMVDGKNTSAYTYSFSCWHPAVWRKMTGAAGWRWGPDVVLGNQSLWRDCAEEMWEPDFENKTQLKHVHKGELN